jgi:succinate dehydrogenase/fumarate reductase cytochrome b subunit (b558 family)
VLCRAAHCLDVPWAIPYIATVSETSSAQPFVEKNRRAYLLRKLHSLSGVVPVGGFMVFHLWENSNALQGQERFDEAVSGISKMPYLFVLEWALILLPLLFHALYGIKLAVESKPNVGRYTYSRNWMYTLQRVTGLLAFAYIGFHLYEYWGQKVFNGMEPAQFYPTLCGNMSHAIGGVPVIALVYIVGIAACVFHFANGLWGFCFSWGLTVSRRSQRMAATAFGVLGLLVFFLGANTVIYFATGKALIGGAGKTGARTCADYSFVSAAR